MGTGHHRPAFFLTVIVEEKGVYDGRVPGMSVRSSNGGRDE